MSDALNELSLFDAAAAVRSGRASASELAAACIARVEQREAEVGAFESFDAERVMASARALDGAAPSGPLHGVPIGIKDIIDTVDHPCRCGSPIHMERRPGWDASCVALCRAAGANIFGKTVTTEFAYFHPGKTRNPHNLDHTPGGSSQGSAAAVADHMLPFAFGTQTAASVTRPAAFCGVIGYKASYGSFDLQGVCGLAPGLDTLGFLCRDLRDIPLVRSVLCSDDSTFVVRRDGEPGPRIGFVRTPHWKQAEPATRRLLEATARSLSAAGARVDEPALPGGFDELAELHHVIMAFEAARARAFEFLYHRDALSDKLVALLDDGMRIGRGQYLRATTRVAAAMTGLDALFDRYDALLAPSAAGEAPAGLGATGDPLFSRMWTALRVPSVTLPAGTGDRGLPLGVQLIGRFNDDVALLSVADWVQRTVLP